MPVAFPSGIAFVWTACSSIASAWVSIWAGVSSTTPAGAVENESFVGLGRMARRAALLHDRGDAGELDGRTAGLRRAVLRPNRDRECDQRDPGDDRDRPHGPPLMTQVEEEPDPGPDRHQREQDEPPAFARVHEGKVRDDHREHDRERQIVVVHRPLLAADAVLRIRLASRPLRLDELSLTGNDHEEDVAGHDRPEHRPELDRHRAGADEVGDAVGGGRYEDEERGGEQELPIPQDPAEGVVDDPGESEEPNADRDQPAHAQVGDAPVDEVRVRVEVVEDDEEREPAQPGRVRLPLEPVQRFRELLRRNLVLLHAVEPAAVDLPRLAGDSSTVLSGPTQMAVERDEVEGRSDPDDARNDVQPPQEQVEPLPEVRVGEQRHRFCHRSRAIATSSLSPVSSSSARVRPRRSRRIGTIALFGRLSTNTTKRKPNFSS